MFVNTTVEMRRGIGGSASIAKRRERDARMEHLGESIEANRVIDAKESLSTFKSKLIEFAEKYRDRIQEDPSFRDQFVTMCDSVGVDPVRSTKSVWSSLIGSFYTDLSVQVLTQCLLQRKFVGPLLPMDTCIASIQCSHAVSAEDIVRAVKSLACLGKGGVSIISIHNQLLISSLPDDMSPDSIHLLSTGWDKGLSVSELATLVEWTQPRCLHALDILIAEGVVWIDCHPETTYWVFSMNHFAF